VVMKGSAVAVLSAEYAVAINGVTTDGGLCWTKVGLDCLTMLAKVLWMRH
jgi:hypothetical protein